MENLNRVQPPVFPLEKIIIPEPEFLSLSNGIPVILLEGGTEDIMRIEFTFKAGQVKETIPLIASATNQMLTEGSRNYTSEELNRVLDYYGAFLNQYVEKDRAGIVIFFLSRHINKILELCNEILLNPVFPELELESLMHKRLRWYLVNREKVQNLAMDNFFETVFGDIHPYGRQVDVTDFEKINSALLFDFHKKYYRPENMAVIISGKIPAETPELLNNFFGNLEMKSLVSEDLNIALSGVKGTKKHVAKEGAVQTSIRIGSTTINKRHPDYTGLKILDMFLGGYFGSRLMKNIREEKGFTYGISSSVSSLDLTGYKVISTDVARKNCQYAIDEIYKEIKLLQSDPVKPEELKIVRNYMSGEILRMFDGPFALAESFKSAWEFGLDNNYYYRLAEKINTIDPDEIIWLAQTYYNIDDLTEITAGLK